MRPILLTASALVIACAGPLAAATFSPLAFPGAGERSLLDRAASRAELDRDLFGAVQAGVIVGRVDLYDRFPYLEARYLQVLSDPAWNRLLFGDPSLGLAAFTGEGSAFGALSEPRGLAADDAGCVYLADSGHDRVLVFKASYDSETMSLTPLYAIGELKAPRDLAWSDGGTPFHSADDRLFVAETGANRIASFAIEGGRFALRERLGALGGGEGRFAGPVAIAARWDAASGEHRVLVSDAHGGRLVELAQNSGGLYWRGAQAHNLGSIEGLDVDAWGNVYAAAPAAGVLRKFSPALEPLGDLEASLKSPRDFCVPAVTVSDHRNGELTRRREPAGLVVEAWGEGSGLRLYALGPDLRELNPAASGEPAASFLLTDRARLKAELFDAGGARVARRDLGLLDAGRGALHFQPADYLCDFPSGIYRLRVTAQSAYSQGGTAEMEAELPLAGGEAVTSPLALLGNFPNPFNPSTTLRFSVPAGGEPLRLAVHDVRGRLLRVLAEGAFSAGEHSVRWDGRDGEGRALASGVYFSRLSQGETRQQGKLLLLK